MTYSYPTVSTQPPHDSSGSMLSSRNSFSSPVRTSRHRGRSSRPNVQRKTAGTGSRAWLWLPHVGQAFKVQYNASRSRCGCAARQQAPKSCPSERNRTLLPTHEALRAPVKSSVRLRSAPAQPRSHAPARRAWSAPLPTTRTSRCRSRYFTCPRLLHPPERPRSLESVNCGP